MLTFFSNVNIFESYNKTNSLGFFSRFYGNKQTGKLLVAVQIRNLLRRCLTVGLPEDSAEQALRDS